MVPNPATTVARIVPTNVVVDPAPMRMLTEDKTAPIPLIQFQDVPLSDAVKNLAKESGVNLSISPDVRKEMDRVDVNIRWQKITPRQALTAILDNYGLILTGDGGDSIARIDFKPKTKN